MSVLHLTVRPIALLAASISLFLGGICALAFYWRYWLWRDCFNELGRCWDPVSEMVYVEPAGPIWGGGAAIFLVVAGVLLYVVFRR